VSTTTAPQVKDMLEHKDCAKEAVEEMFTSICQMSLTPHQLKPEDAADTAAIVAVVSLVGDIAWTLCQGLPESTATAVAAKFAGFAIPFDSNDMGDAIGELANVFAGNAKAKLDTNRVAVEISLPTIMRGKVVELLKARGLPAYRWDFTSPVGALWVEVIAGREVVPTRKSGE